MAGRGSVFSIEGGKRYRGVLMVMGPNGRTRPKTFTGKTARLVRNKIRAFMETYDPEIFGQDMTVSQVCRSAIAICEDRGCRDKTLRGYRSFLELHIEPYIGRLSITDLRPRHVEHLMDEMDAASQTKGLVRAFLRMSIRRVALKNGLVVVNVAALADPPRLQHQSRPRITPTDLKLILDAQPNPVLRAMYLTIATTGLRIAETRYLTWNEIVEREDGMWIQLSESKTPEGLKAIPLAAATWVEIKALGKRSVCVFPSRVGTPIGESNFRRAWIAALNRAGVKQTNAYQLRKLFGSMKARTSSEDVLKRLMRHKDARTTHQFYVEAFDEDLRKAVEE